MPHKKLTPELYERYKANMAKARSMQFKTGIRMSTEKAKLLRKMRNGANRLPQDHPLREAMGLQLDPFKCMRAVEKDMTDFERKEYGGMVRKVKNWEQQMLELDKLDEPEGTE